MKVQLFTKDACMQCKATKRRLDKHGLAYDEHRLEHHPDVVADLKSRGYLQAPGVILRDTDGTVLDAWGGFDVAKIDAAVARIREADAAAYLAAENAPNVERIEDHR